MADSLELTLAVSSGGHDGYEVVFVAGPERAAIRIVGPDGARRDVAVKLSQLPRLHCWASAALDSFGQYDPDDEVVVEDDDKDDDDSEMEFEPS